MTSPLAGACLTCLACLLAPCAVISGGNSHPKINTDDLSKIDAQFSSTCFPGKGCEVVTSATKGQTHTHTLLSHQPCLAMDVFRAISNKAGTVAEVWRSAGFTDKLLMFEFFLTLLICRTQTESAKAPPLISLDVISLIYRT